MGRSSAGGGGGHSGGGGGGRSGGHRSSGSSRSSRGFSSGSSSSGSSGHYHHHSYGGGWNYYGHGWYGRPTNLLGATIVLIFLFFNIVWPRINFVTGNAIPPSTVQREALSKEYVNETSYFMDDLGYIKSKTKVNKGMKYFFDKTGVQPYIWITDNVNGEDWPSDAVIDAELEKMYNNLFTDKQHFLLMYLDAGNGAYITRYYCGSGAKVLMDEEASEILLSYIDNMTTTSMDDDTFFSSMWTKSADRIMSVTTNKFDVMKVGIILLVIVAVIVGIILILKQRQRTLQARQEMLRETEELINTPLSGPSHRDN